jgi:hypothetical protein
MPGSTGQFMHGVTTVELPTQLIAPIVADAAINVVVGCSPIHLVTGRPTYVNEPRLYNTFADAVMENGYSDDWASWTICEHMNAAFQQFNVKPVVYINVFNPDDHQTPVPPSAHGITNKQVILPDKNIIYKSLNVKDSAGTITYVLNTDYTAAYNRDGNLVLSIMSSGSIAPDATSLTIGYNVANPEGIDKADIIGGIDMATGKATGIECIEDVFLAYKVVPNILLCPGWSQDPEVASVMVAKMEAINGCFVGICVCDVDTEAVKNPVDVPDWKEQNNYVFERQLTVFPETGPDRAHLQPVYSAWAADGIYRREAGQQRSVLLALEQKLQDESSCRRFGQRDPDEQRQRGLPQCQRGCNRAELYRRLEVLG